MLAMATIALVLFILVLGDIRRKGTPLSEAMWYADELSQRLEGTKALPMNLELLDVPPEHRRKLQKFEWLTREQARTLRRTSERLIVAHTKPISRILAPDGRAVVFFHAGQFQAEWLSLSEFDKLHGVQQQILQRRKPGDAVNMEPGP